MLMIPGQFAHSQSNLKMRQTDQIPLPASNSLRIGAICERQGYHVSSMHDFGQMNLEYTSNLEREGTSADVTSLRAFKYGVLAPPELAV